MNLFGAESLWGQSKRLTLIRHLVLSDFNSSVVFNEEKGGFGWDMTNAYPAFERELFGLDCKILFQ